MASLAPSGINANNKVQLNMYPNPASSSLTFQVSSAMQQKVSNLSIYDALGKVVLQTEMRNNKQTINISHLPGGMYFAQLIVDGQSITKKVIIQH